MKLFLSGVVNSLGSGFPVYSLRLSEAPEKPQNTSSICHTMGSVLGFEEFVSLLAFCLGLVDLF